MNERDDIAVDDAFANKAKTLFDQSVDGLDGETRSRLNRGRQEALAEATRGGFRWMQIETRKQHRPHFPQSAQSAA